MKINDDCINCGSCIPFCPMGAIAEQNGVVQIDQDECVECCACSKSKICPMDALYVPELEYPRTIRRELSDPTSPNISTVGKIRSDAIVQSTGRGTAEMKSNDVTDRFKYGEVGFGIELGRPSMGVWMRDAEKAVMTILQSDIGIKIEKENPIYGLIEDPNTGKFKKEILNEKVLSVIFEFSTGAENMETALQAIKEAARKVDTVFSISLITRAASDESLPNVERARALGYYISPNAKVNIGLGKRLEGNK